MAVKRITPEETLDYEGLPLIGDYLKDNPKELNTQHDVLTVKIAKSQMWLMCDTEKFRVMYNMKSKQAKALIDLCKGLDGCLGHKMVAITEKTSKGYGAFIAADDAEKREYFWDETTLDILPEGSGSNRAKKQELTPESFGATKLK